nr:MAG TPA: hypothetical protein [Caudoviricetes sp.]
MLPIKVVSLLYIIHLTPTKEIKFSYILYTRLGSLSRVLVVFPTSKIRFNT